MSKLDLGLTPKEIVAQLDKYIIGQHEAKKAVAIALRQRRWRMHISPDLRDDVTPKNILMIGPTGVGKTEIARRLAKLYDSPFIKVEATKFTEIGYVGRDVDSIVRELVDIAINNMEQKAKREMFSSGRTKAIEIILDIVLGKTSSPETRDKFRKRINDGELDHNEIEVQIQEGKSSGNALDIYGLQGMSIVSVNDMIGKALNGRKTKIKKMIIRDAIELLADTEAEKLIDREKIIQHAISRVENDGIVFLDEIDKITSKSDGGRAEVSREGVQRDLLPLLEGTTVITKYGSVKTNHILFIASGAFHIAKPSELLPELQGRLPIRVELHALSKRDFVRILTEPTNSLVKQYQALMLTEAINLNFTEDALELIAYTAADLNNNVENIGARRLHTIMEKVLEDISYEVTNERRLNNILIDKNFVSEKLRDICKNDNLVRYIL